MADSVILAVSQPDRPSGRGLALRSSPVKAKALELGIPVETPERCRAPEFVERIGSLGADLLLVAAYGQILPLALLEATKRGAFNLHGSLLPKYRGAAPIQRAIEQGETETGVTLMKMDVGMDTGDIVAEIRTEIGENETAGELAERLAHLGAMLALVWLPKIVTGDYPRTKQNDDEATLAPKISKSEAEIAFDADALSAYRRIRAFTPSPGAFLRTSNGMFRIGKARFELDHGSSPGEILAVAPDLVVGFHEGAITLLEIQPEGRARMRGTEWANGARLKVGMNLRPE